MKFNLAIDSEATKAFEYLTILTAKDSIAEVKKISPKRTLNQNSYLHLIIGYFGLHFGYNLEEAKFIYKQINQSIYRYKKKDRTFWRSSADLTKEEMAKSIDKFMEKSKEFGCELPPATDLAWLIEVENAIEVEKRL